MSRLGTLLDRRKYELLVLALLQHLFIAAVLPDLRFYASVVWPINMVILGVFSVGIFRGRAPLTRVVKHLSSIIVVLFPLVVPVLGATDSVMTMLSVAYGVFFLVITVEVLRFLLRPSYVNVDILLAVIAGYLLLLEMGIFVCQAVFYLVPGSFAELSEASFTATYLDLVYFCTMTITSIGYGDIAPVHHIAKLTVSILGVLGQLYVVLLMGILISKYAGAGPAAGADS